MYMMRNHTPAGEALFLGFDADAGSADLKQFGFSRSMPMSWPRRRTRRLLNQVFLGLPNWACQTPRSTRHSTPSDVVIRSSLEVTGSLSQPQVDEGYGYPTVTLVTKSVK